MIPNSAEPAVAVSFPKGGLLIDVARYKHSKRMLLLSSIAWASVQGGQ
jgi:hypothetical protein